MKRRNRNKSNEHQLFKVTLIVGVSDQASGLESILKAMRHDPTLVVVSTDEVRLRLLSDTKGFSDLATDIVIAEQTAPIVAGDQPSQRKRTTVHRHLQDQTKKRWTDKDKATIQELRSEGVPTSQIALVLNRTRASVSHQIHNARHK